MDTESTNDLFQPPYISFTQLENMLERMRLEGIPARIDRSYLASWSGSAQSQFLRAAVVMRPPIASRDGVARTVQPLRPARDTSDR